MSHLSFTALRIVAALVLPALAGGCSRDDQTRSPATGAIEREVMAAAPAGGAAGTTGLVVHEWGTFTSMQGADGASLDGLHHEEEELPSFVHSNAGASLASPFRAFGDHSLDRPARRVNSKMETPVIYFYAKEKQRVSVHVDYEQGLLTQWYPAASRALPLLPDVGPAGSAPAIDIGSIRRSTLEWELDLVPDGMETGALPAVPAVSADHPWQFAREVRSAFVTAVPQAGSAAPAESERYVFYRGLGRFSPPVRVTPMEGGMAVVTNHGAEPVDAAFVLQVTGSSGRFQRLDDIGASSSRGVKLDGAATPKEALSASLSRDVALALVKQGLFEDEAKAMVRTWAPTWFASEGTRVIYLVPRALVDAVLPLKITPEPSKLTRVLVARHEFLTPETTREVTAALLERLSSEPAARERAATRLARLGRFIEPAVRNAVAQAGGADARVAKSGAEVLAAFR